MLTEIIWSDANCNERLRFITHRLTVVTLILIKILVDI